MNHILLTAATALVLANAAHAQGRDRTMTMDEVMQVAETRFETMDGDGNGSLTQAEYLNANLERFDRADKNDDGEISRGERRGMQAMNETGRTRTHADFESTLERRFGGYDADGSGTVSAEEFKAGWQRAFERADGNGDGELRRGELRRLQPIEG